MQPTELSAEPGDRVTVTGKLGDGRLMGAVEATGGSAQAQAVAPGPRETAVLLVTFPGEPAEPWSRGEARSEVFTAVDSVSAFYQEESYGEISLTGKLNEEGDVFGWFSLDTPTASCAWETWRSAADEAATEAGIDLSGYQHLIYEFPYQESCGSVLGVASLGGNWAMINGDYFNLGFRRQTTVHELGHNLGLYHAGSWTCTSGEVRVQISNTCTVTEYGDPFDAMGNKGLRHNNGWNLAKLGILTPENVETIEASGTYTLDSALQPTAEPTVLRIPRTRNLSGGVTSWYYLEVRETGGVFENVADASTTGVSIRATAAGASPETLLLDANPETASFYDAPLGTGQTFDDRSVRIETVVAGGGGATVSVEFDEEPPTAPTDVTATAGIEGMQLQWSASSDNFGVDRYVVFRDDAEVGASASLGFLDTRVSLGEHEYVVYAEDAAGNRSPASEPATATLPEVSDPICAADGCRVVFRYSGAATTWTVPPGVGEAEFTVEGAQGGSSSSLGALFDRGARVVSTLASLTDGDEMAVSVGGAGKPEEEGGAGGFNGGGDGALGGGGGGFSSVSIDAAPMLLAGGGGGDGSKGFDAVAEAPRLGGRGGRGGETGTPGTGGAATETSGATLGGGAGGASGGAGGAGGAGGDVTGTSSCPGGASGGADGVAGTSFFGGGGSAAGGGGGGGYVGGGQGGGGGADACGSRAGSGGGGGGSSFAAAGLSATFTSGARRGDGEVSIAYPNPIGAAARSYVTEPDQALAVPAKAGVLAGATAPEEDPLTATAVSDPAHGALTLNGDGSFTYTPAPGYAGADSFAYRATDVAENYATATVALTVAEPPTAAISAPLTGGSYMLGQVVHASFSCAEGLGGPGISACTGTVANGAAIDTSTLGGHTFTVIAISQDGLEGEASVTYTVEAPAPETPEPPAPGPVAEPPAPVPPRLTIAIETARARVVQRSARVLLTCSGGALASVCRGTLSLLISNRLVKRSRRRPAQHTRDRRALSSKWRLAGRTHYAVASGKTRAVSVRLRRAAWWWLRRTRRGVLRVRATAAGGQAAHRAVVLHLHTRRSARPPVRKRSSSPRRGRSR